MTARPGALGALAICAALVGCSAGPSPAGPSATADLTLAASPTARPGPSSPEAGGTVEPTPELTFSVQGYQLPPGSRPHDIAPAADGGVWYTGQRSGELGWLDPESGDVRLIRLGAGSAPHGVVVGPDGAPWVTDGGLNAIVRVDPASGRVDAYPLPAEAANANLNTAAFDGDGTLWFTGQRGFYGSFEPSTETMRVFEAPRGAGPYGIAATPAGDVYYSSLAGSYLGAIDRVTGSVTVIEPPTSGAGLRRVWADSGGRLWVSEWFAGQVAVFDPADGSWREWPLPGPSPQAYAVYVDETDAVWLTDFGGNAIVRFDPETEEFRSFPAEGGAAEVRQLLGREGEVWGAESARDRLVVVRYSG